jgi:hypothetical protein
MARLPIDGQALTLVATGKYRAVPKYAEIADGSRRAVPGSQETDGTGTPLWAVDVLLDDDDSDRAQAVSVKVASASEPQLPKYQPVQFVGLTCTPYVDRNTRRVALSFSASGIASGSGASASSSAKTATAGK